MTDATVEKNDVHRIAHLARLQLTESEANSMTQDLARILTYVARLDTIDPSGIEPVTHGVDPKPYRRTDDIQSSPGAEQALRNAPERLGDGFGVPQIIE